MRFSWKAAGDLGRGLCLFRPSVASARPAVQLVQRRVFKGGVTDSIRSSNVEFDCSITWCLHPAVSCADAVSGHEIPHQTSRRPFAPPPMWPHPWSQRKSYIMEVCIKDLLQNDRPTTWDPATAFKILWKIWDIPGIHCNLLPQNRRLKSQSVCKIKSAVTFFTTQTVSKTCASAHWHHHCWLTAVHTYTFAPRLWADCQV